MRMDLAGGPERRSTTTTEAAEIDFMNIKQQGSILGQGCYSQHRDTHLWVCVGLDAWRFFFFFFQDIRIVVIQIGIQTK